MRRLTMLILLAAMGARLTFAQEDIPIYTEIEQMYPAGAGFIIDIGVPFSQIEAVTLTFEGERIERQQIELDLANAQILPEMPEAPEGVILPSPTPSSTTRLGYAWALEIDNLPRLFSEITYTWDVELRNRPTAHYEGSFTFRDPRFNWVHFNNPSLNLVFAESVANSTVINGELRTIHNRLSEITRANIPINLIIYPDGVTSECDQREAFFFARAYFIGVDFPCSPQVAAAVLQQSNFVAFTNPSGASLRTLLVEWLIDTYLTNYWSNTDAPLWFQASVKQFFNAENSASLSVSRTIVRSNQQLTLNQMAQAASASNQATWDAQSYSMMLYIVDKVGVEGLYSLMQASPRDFDARYESVMQEPLNRILLNWQRWLFTSNAEVASGVNPYQLPTVAPSATPTATFTPTQTLTQLPTNTPPPPTDTLSPSITPSRTPTLAPPTNTPRSASDLFTPTPIPPTNTPTNISSTTQSIVLAILIIFIALAVVAFIRIGKR